MKRYSNNALTMTLLLSICISGCQKPQTSDLQTVEGPLAEDDVSAQELFQAVISKYTDADSYYDKAVLYLTYRLDGKAIREPHPWSVAWNRDGQFSGDLFNAKIRNDGQHLSCYVFDIESGNIDNQHLLVPAQAFDYLLKDPIACHFLFGTSELPLDELEAQTENRLIPPMLGFAQFDLLPKWLQSPESISLGQDDHSVGVECYLLRLVHETRIYELWINKLTGNIEQIQLPLEYLDSQILASEQVTDMRFFVRFHDAVLNSKIGNEQFAISDRLAASKVRKFVTLPESLPSEKLGETIGELDLLTPQGERFVMSKQANAHILLWAQAFNAQAFVAQLGRFPKTDDGTSTAIYVVYSDDLVRTPGSCTMQEAFEKSVLDAGAIPLFDSQLEFISKLGIKSVPAIVVLNSDHEIQFVKNLDEKLWLDELQVAVKRIVAGENLANEMKQDYQKFLDEYHQQLLAVASTDSSTANSGRATQQHSAKTRWHNTDLTSPGNVHVPASNDRMIVMDGWQSVAELDLTGRLLRSKRLRLPEHIGVNRIRSITTQNGKTHFVAFSMLGKNAFVFNDEWKLLFDFDSSNLAGEPGITECQLVIEESKIQLLASVLGVDGILSQTPDGRQSTLSSGACKSFVATESHLFRIDEHGKLYVDEQLDHGLSDWSFSSLKVVPGVLDRFIGLARNAQGFWRCFCINNNGEVWSQSVAPAALENAMEGLAVSLIGNEIFVLVPEDDGLVMIGRDFRRRISANGSGKITGMAMFGFSKQPLAIVTRDGKVLALELKGREQTFIPASVRTDR